MVICVKSSEHDCGGFAGSGVFNGVCVLYCKAEGLRPLCLWTESDILSEK